MPENEIFPVVVGPSSVVLAYIFDIRDQNGKMRPCVVVKSDEFRALVLAITTTFDPNKLQSDEIRLPYSENCGTGLDKPSVVKCSWFDVINLSRCTQVGRVPAKLMGPILETFRRVNSASEVTHKIRKRKND